MEFLVRTKQKISQLLKTFFRKRTCRIGIYGPPNAGKTTLANRIVRDWTGDAVGPVSEVPHETRRVRRKQDITITGQNGHSITFDIVDTPGVTTKIDYNEFIEYGLRRRGGQTGTEATEGVARRCTGSVRISTALSTCLIPRRTRSSR